MNRTKLIVLAVGTSLLAAGCGSAAKGSPTPGKFTEAAFDPTNFVDPRVGGNPWFPLEPGRQWLRQGTTLVGNRQVPHKVVVTVTDAIRCCRSGRAAALREGPASRSRDHAQECLGGLRDRWEVTRLWPHSHPQNAPVDALGARS